MAATVMLHALRGPYGGLLLASLLGPPSASAAQISQALLKV